MTNEIPKPPAEELDEPMRTITLPPLPDFPNREWLSAVIVEVEYEYANFNGKIQYLEDKDKNQILDENDQPQPRKQFKITYEMVDYELPNGAPRKAWLHLGLSFGPRAKLPGYLAEFPIIVDHDNLPTPKEIIELLKGKHVFIQFANITDESGEIKQRLVKDAIQVAVDLHSVKDKESTDKEFFAKPEDKPKSNPATNELSSDEEKAWDE